MFFATAVVALLSASAFGVSHADGVTAVISALDIEIDPVAQALRDRQDKVIAGVHFVEGKFGGLRVVVVASGVGKVNAAFATAILIEHFNPDRILSTGIAGALNPALSPGDIVVASKTVQHDVGTVDENGFHSRSVKNPTGEPANPLFFPANGRLLAQSETAAIRTAGGSKVLKGIITSGDMFVSSSEKKIQLRNDFGADAVDMEAAAVAQICWRQGIPYLAIRGISDRGDGRAPEFFSKFGLRAADRAANLALDILRQIDDTR